ncbi:MAG: FKBP-type peptidyl-prolyl cis-trans isomerase [Desulfobacterales bacterium]|nr:FKBP-type peptidyl-prolyl cis-trans isomerase [Desulfobacterales bacterium]
MEKSSYAFGHNVGANMNKGNIEVDIENFIKGMKAGLSGKKSMFSQAESKEIMIRFQKSLMDAKFNKNKAKEEQFLTANLLKEGIKETQSGLQYKVIKKGTGKTPTQTNKVTVHYKGTKLSGQTFDSSYNRGKPITFQVTGVVKGWQEALLLMREGAKWQLFIPSRLAYGKRGAGRSIGPGEMLLFDIELISVQ